MVVDRQAQSAEFAEDGRAILHHRVHGGTGILVHIFHVAIAAIFPSAGTIHQARRVQRFHPLQDGVGIVLAPPFVERHPGDNAGRVAQIADLGFQLAAVIGVFVLSERQVLSAVPLHRGVVLRHGAGHVLPHHEPQLVAPIVIPRRFDLHVLAAHVKTHALERVDIGAEGRIGGRRVETVGPPALIERTDGEGRAAIQKDTVEAGQILADLHLAHAEIAGHGVALGKVDLYVVERGRIG